MLGRGGQEMGVNKAAGYQQEACCGTWNQCSCFCSTEPGCVEVEGLRSFGGAP
jgi:hypothetical protein